MENLTIVSVSSAAEANRYVLEGLQNRRVGVTNMNSRSSRSHAIFTLYMTCEAGREGVIPRCCALLFEELAFRREKPMRVKVSVVR